MGKKLTLTNNELLTITRGCQTIQVEYDLIAPLDFKLTKVVNTLRPHATEYTEAVEKLRNKYAVKDENGEFVTEKNENDTEQFTFTDDEAKEKFISEVGKLEKSEVEIHLPISFKYDEFVDENNKPLKLKKGYTYMISDIVDI